MRRGMAVAVTAPRSCIIFHQGGPLWSMQRPRQFMSPAGVPCMSQPSTRQCLNCCAKSIFGPASVRSIRCSKKRNSAPLATVEISPRGLAGHRFEVPAFAWQYCCRVSPRHIDSVSIKSIVSMIVPSDSIAQDRAHGENRLATRTKLSAMIHSHQTNPTGSEIPLKHLSTSQPAFQKFPLGKSLACAIAGAQLSVSLSARFSAQHARA